MCSRGRGNVGSRPKARNPWLRVRAMEIEARSHTVAVWPSFQDSSRDSEKR